MADFSCCSVNASKYGHFYCIKFFSRFKGISIATESPSFILFLEVRDLHIATKKSSEEVCLPETAA